MASSSVSSSSETALTITSWFIMLSATVNAGAAMSHWSCGILSSTQQLQINSNETSTGYQSQLSLGEALRQNCSDA